MPFSQARQCRFIQSVIRLDKLWHPKVRKVNTLATSYLDVRIRSAPPLDGALISIGRKPGYTAMEHSTKSAYLEDWRQAELWSYVQRKGHGLLQLEQILDLQ